MVEYLKFYEQKMNSYHARTRKFTIRNTTGIQLGLIRWDNRWRTYVAELEENTQWAEGCLDELKNFIKQLNDEQKIIQEKSKELADRVDNKIVEELNKGDNHVRK